MFTHILEKQLYCFHCCGCDFNWLKLGQFGKFFYHHQNGIFSLPFQKTHHKIHWYPFIYGFDKISKGLYNLIFFLYMHQLGVISFYTNAHAMVYVFFHFGPIEVFKVTLVVFSPWCPTIGMSCISCMTLMHNFPSNTYTTYFHFGNLFKRVKPFTFLLFATPQSSYGKRFFT